MARTKREFIDWVVSELGIRSTNGILEVGYDPGVAIERIAEITREGFVAGVGPSPVMVKQATARNSKEIEAGRVELK